MEIVLAREIYPLEITEALLKESTIDKFLAEIITKTEITYTLEFGTENTPEDQRIAKFLNHILERAVTKKIAS
jgi:hypothetical protein